MKHVLLQNVTIDTPKFLIVSFRWKKLGCSFFLHPMKITMWQLIFFEKNLLKIIIFVYVKKEGVWIKCSLGCT